LSARASHEVFFPSRFHEGYQLFLSPRVPLDDALYLSGEPQSSQNFAVGPLSAPHFAQRLEKGVPHSGQNFLPEVLSVPHFEQRIEIPPCGGRVSPLGARINRAGVGQPCDE
jgi:hypothetical protein